MQEQLHIAVIQTDLAWENPEKNREHFSMIIAGLQHPVDLVVLPESFTTGFSMNTAIAEEGTETLQWMQQLSTKYHTALAGSFFVKEGERYTNRLYMVFPDTKEEYYDKKHLFRLTNEQQIFSPGTEQKTVQYKGWKIGLQVCYDLRFPVWTRRTDAYDYDLLLFVANWPERRSFAWNHLPVARAIENQSYVIGCNRVGYDGNMILHAGDSMIIDPMGKLLQKAAPFKEEVLYATLSREEVKRVRKMLPFHEDRDRFEFVK